MAAGAAINASTARKNPLSRSTPNAGAKPLRNGAPNGSAPNNTAAPAAPIKTIPAAWSVNAIRHQRLPNDSSTPDPTATTPVAPTISATLTP